MSLVGAVCSRELHKNAVNSGICQKRINCAALKYSQSLCGESSAVLNRP